MIEADYLKKKLRKWSMTLRNTRKKMKRLRRKLKLKTALRTTVSKLETLFKMKT